MSRLIASMALLAVTAGLTGCAVAPGYDYGYAQPYYPDYGGGGGWHGGGYGGSHGGSSASGGGSSWSSGGGGHGGHGR
ncbi:hypothetical protein B0G81_6885 [Paraburkholderia sp. BL6665CI2N2]|uniref:hypothetical protein n=1 Tax=Paraburkholderia sp. BL6665CI2N2 TaxID=1938806 RepID=UPI0010663F56|nr:hypothetical protein [Paraburkholderia sp. BL6665CI2N2]TDY26371.1 hypothetical protein B0G81_6885 [Paraburkholderia sp. BL6665CI2N2]